MRRSFFLASVAVVVTTLVMSVAAGASPASRPFKGSIAGTVTFVGDPSCPIFLRTNSAAEGTVSHLGMTTMTSTHCSGLEFSGRMTLVAANGDELVADYWNDGIAPLPDEIGDVYEVPVDFEIVGGTGRFEHAVGGGDMTAYIVFEGLGDPEWPADWVWQGTIGY